MLINFVLKYSPNFLIHWAKQLKKKYLRKQLQEQKKNKSGISKAKLIEDFKKIGIKNGDSVLVHSSLSKIGFVDGGAETIINALFEIIGDRGTLLFPSFPYSGRAKTYLEKTPCFHINETPSQMGVITEYFRTSENVFRSFHPTDPVCAKGPLADYYTNSHLGQITPYNENSPFRKLCNKNGKILMLGTKLSSCTSLHTLEDAVDFKYPVYDSKIFDVKMIDASGNKYLTKTKVHNPVYSSKRNCDALMTMFESEKVLANGKIGAAKSILIDANKMLEVMIKKYIENGVTMYTPFGS